VKSFAVRNNININFVEGTGKGGRVTKEDIINHIRSTQVIKSKSSPSVRVFAKQNKLDINKIQGSGEEGRVTKEDVIQHIHSVIKKPAGSSK
jgi:pyruvate/2-oxoglutarate dehydrogenase complex dihydrolipoamide acyltransferase (E2) component